MGRIERFEDIIVWKKSKEICIMVYRVFESCKDLSFRDQVQRCSVSIMNNIAEGFERKGNKELRKFFTLRKGQVPNCDQ